MPMRTAPPRRRRGRVLFIAAPDLAAMARGHLHRPPAETDDLFEAMTMIAQSSARDLIAVAVVGEDAVPEGDADRITGALRRIDPSVELIRCSSNGSVDPTQAQREGFDQVVAGQGGVESVFRVLGDAYMIRPAGYEEETDRVEPAATASTQPPAAPDLHPDPAPGLPPAEPTPTETELSPDAEAVTDPGAESEAEAAPTEPQPVDEPAAPAEEAQPERHPPVAAEPTPLPPNRPKPDVTESHAPLVASAESTTAEARDEPVPPAPQDEPPSPIAAAQAGHAETERAADRPAPPPAPSPRPTTPPRDRIAVRSAGEKLGDIDLVRAMLDDPDGEFHVTVLALARQQTGWDDLELAETPPDPSDERAACRIAIGETGLWLVTGRAAHRQLRPWANWMTDWLCLANDLARHREMAYTDDLTCAQNRRAFERFMAETIELARERRRPVTVMVFDIDNFKQFNDSYGHAAGDEVLCEIVRLIRSVIRTTDRIFRIGGDEFVVVFSDNEGPRELGSEHPDSVERIARRFQAQVNGARFPCLGSESASGLTISGGLSTFPWDGQTAVELLGVADRRAIASKGLGKNHIMFGPGADEAQHAGSRRGREGVDGPRRRRRD